MFFLKLTMAIACTLLTAKTSVAEPESLETRAQSELKAFGDETESKRDESWISSIPRIEGVDKGRHYDAWKMKGTHETPRVFLRRYDVQGLQPSENQYQVITENGTQSRNLSNKELEAVLATNDIEVFPEFIKKIRESLHEKSGAEKQEFLAELIKSGKIDSIETLLKCLPLDIRRRYTLVWYSQSLQKASFESPRVIMYTGNGDFVLTVNDEKMPGGNTIETISVNKKTGEFHFQGFTFDGAPKVLAKNDVSCLTCHTGSLANPRLAKPFDKRPNWDNYPLWMGTFGAGEFGSSGGPIFRRVQHRASFRPDISKNISETEKSAEANMFAQLKRENVDLNRVDLYKKFKEFQKTQSSRPRYKYLRSYTNGELNEEFPNLKNKIRRDDYPYYYYGYIDYDSPFELRPDYYFGIVMMSWNIKRVANQFKERPNYQKVKRNLLRYFLGCLSDPGLENQLKKDLQVDDLEMTTLVFKLSHGWGNDGTSLPGDNGRLAYQIGLDVAQDDQMVKAALKPRKAVYGMESITPYIDPASAKELCELLKR